MRTSAFAARTPVGARACACVIALGACRPDLGPSDGLVTAPRVLAVRAEPPEAKPGAQATYTAFLASPAGVNASAVVHWSFCDAPKPLAEDDVVSSACLDAAALVPAGEGPSVVAATPARACAVFGPETPAGGLRPRDPDVTGGYYQPLRVDWDGADPTFYLARIQCDLAGASAGVVAAYAAQYVANANPHLLPLSVRSNGTLAPFASLSRVAAGTHVTFESAWPAADAESYVALDPASQTLTTRREAMRVAWATTGGSFDSESTGRDEGDLATTSDNGWTAPAAGAGTVEGASPVRLWLTLRDSRGGVDVAVYDVVVTSP